MLIAVDFDGTCVDFAFPLIGHEKPWATEVLGWLASRHQLVLWTARQDHPMDPARQYLRYAISWLEERSIPLAGTNTLPADPFVEYTKPIQFRKMAADLYLDDKNFPPRCNFDWAEVCMELLGFHPSEACRYEDCRSVQDLRYVTCAHTVVQEHSFKEIGHGYSAG